MAYVNCETEKSVRIRLFENKLSLIKEDEIFSIIIFKKKFIGILKYWIFPALLFSDKLRGLCES